VTRLGRQRQGKWKTGGLVVGVAVLGVAIGTAIRLAALQPSDAAPPNASPSVPSGDIQAALTHKPGFRVLFVGNSLTYGNDVPNLVARPASGTHGIPRPFLAVGWTPGGSTLANALQNPSFRRLLAATRWNVIVLQEGPLKHHQLKGKLRVTVKDAAANQTVIKRTIKLKR
jgi:hypothetical protein